MKQIILFLAVAAFLSCNSAEKTENTRLPGEFKYTTYHWNDTRDSAGISVTQHMQIAEDGKYRLISRNPDGTAAYYFGFIGWDKVSALARFMAESSLQTAYVDTPAKGGPVSLFDYENKSGQHKIKFTSNTAPDGVKSTQATLDSIINAPDKKATSFFNIDNYIRQIAVEDSAGRMK